MICLNWIKIWMVCQIVKVDKYSDYSVKCTLNMSRLSQGMSVVYIVSVIVIIPLWSIIIAIIWLFRLRYSVLDLLNDQYFHHSITSTVWIFMCIFIMADATEYTYSTPYYISWPVKLTWKAFMRSVCASSVEYCLVTYTTNNTPSLHCLT